MHCANEGFNGVMSIWENPRSAFERQMAAKSVHFLEYLYGCGEKKFPPHSNTYPF